MLCLPRSGQRGAHLTRSAHKMVEESKLGDVEVGDKLRVLSTDRTRASVGTVSYVDDHEGTLDFIYGKRIPMKAAQAPCYAENAGGYGSTLAKVGSLPLGSRPGLCVRVLVGPRADDPGWCWCTEESGVRRERVLRPLPFEAPDAPKQPDPSILRVSEGWGLEGSRRIATTPRDEDEPWAWRRLRRGAGCGVKTQEQGNELFRLGDFGAAAAWYGATIDALLPPLQVGALGRVGSDDTKGTSVPPCHCLGSYPPGLSVG
jgi:hypothetical protein